MSGWCTQQSEGACPPEDPAGIRAAEGFWSPCVSNLRPHGASLLLVSKTNRFWCGSTSLRRQRQDILSPWNEIRTDVTRRTQSHFTVALRWATLAEWNILPYRDPFRIRKKSYAKPSRFGLGSKHNSHMSSRGSSTSWTDDDLYVTAKPS